MKSTENEIFSKGTDFKYIYYLLKEGKVDQADTYLRQIYDVAVDIGTFNKPLIANIGGPICNSAAAALSQVSYLLV